MIICYGGRESNKQTVALESMMQELACHIARKRIKATRRHIRKNIWRTRKREKVGRFV